MGSPPYAGLSILVIVLLLLRCRHSRPLHMLVLNLVETGKRLTGEIGQAQGQQRLASVRPANTATADGRQAASEDGGEINGGENLLSKG